MILRPYGVVINGALELGLELVLEHESPTGPSTITAIRPHTGIPDPYVVSPAFVNAHSHLEYRGLMGKLPGTTYWPWIREITKAKLLQTSEEVEQDCITAARENRSTGVAMIAEHSDRPFAGKAMAAEGLSGMIFQEIITLGEFENPAAKLSSVDERVRQNFASFGGPVFRTPHAYHTVDPATLSKIGASGDPFSIHVGETKLETEFTRDGSGPIADFYSSIGVQVRVTGLTVVQSLHEVGLVRRGAQFVHCCDLAEDDIRLIRENGVTVAHCPRSNSRLQCPAAPVRELLDAGIQVGLGLDSAASSGPIDMFDEMRSALDTSIGRGKPVQPEEVWRMATSMGASSIPFEAPKWDIFEGSSTPLIKLNLASARCTDDLISSGCPDHVVWV